MATTSLRQNDDEQPRKARAHATDEETGDEAPTARRVIEDEAPPRRRPRPAVTMDEEDAPPPRRRAVVEEDAPPPRRRAAVEEIDEEDAPPPRRKSREPEPEEDEDPAPPPRRRSRPEPEEKEEPPRRTTALARRQDMSVDKPRIQQVEGEITSRDMGTPYLNLGQKSGDLCEDHQEWLGTWVYDKAHGLGGEIRIIALHYKKQYEEKLPYGSQDIPMIFNKAEQAREAGVEHQEIARIDLLIEVHPSQKHLKKYVCLTDDEGYQYIPAQYIVRSTAYGVLTRELMKHYRAEGEIANMFYLLTTEKCRKRENTYWAPIIAEDGPVSKELRAQLTDELAV